MRKIVDMFGTELQIGDTVCFTLSMRIDQKPLVKAVIKGFIYGKKPNYWGCYTDWLDIDYIETSEVNWARDEGKLVKKVSPNRVVKCY